METHVSEIADRIYRFSTFVPEIAPPSGFTFNQFLIDAEEPLLFHCGHRAMFGSISGALRRILPLEKLRWISFSHLEADECGSMNDWLAAAPRAQILHGVLGCDISLRDMAEREPRALEDGEVVLLGDRRVRFLATPHVPHAWDAGLLYEEETATLFASDLLGQIGKGPALADDAILEPALKAERMFQSMPVTARTFATLERLAGLGPRTLAIMHGSSFSGNGGKLLKDFGTGLARENGLASAQPSSA